MFESKPLLIGLGLIIIGLGWWLFEWFRFYHYMQIGKRLAAQAEPFSQSLENANFSILVIGDSTAVGTGTTDNKFSVPGRLGADFPNAKVTNLGVNGTLISGLNAQLDQVADQKFDLILIQAGGNDVVYFSDLKTVSSKLEIVLQKALKKSDRVIMMSSGNVGAAPIWPTGINWLMTHRTLKAREIFESVTAENQVAYVNLWEPKGSDPFQKQPDLYHAADNFHPSDQGYALWYEKLQLKLERLNWR